MYEMIKAAMVVSVVTLLVACGGGGGGAAPVAATSGFPLHDIFVSMFTTASSNNFTLSGTGAGYDVTGSGTLTTSTLNAGTFEGAAAQQRTVSFIGSISANGETAPLAGYSIDWVDSNYNPLGYSDNEYVVVTSLNPIPNSVHVNDTGTWLLANRYPTSDKTTLKGTKTITYALEADTENSALLTLTSIDKDTNGVTAQTQTEQYRVTPAGAYRIIKMTYVDSDVNLLMSY